MSPQQEQSLADHGLAVAENVDDEGPMPVVKPATGNEQDARDRIADARFGSLAGIPSVEYLTRLRAELQEWLGTVQAELEIARSRERGSWRDG